MPYFSDRIYVLDGAMGTMIQKSGCCCHDFNSELLNIESPELIRKIHESYIEAGADIITTNSFGANTIVQSTHSLESEADRMAFAAASIARKAADSAGRKILVAGNAGPTGKSLTLAGDASRPAEREMDFDTMSESYRRQFKALMDAGADIILLETCFDALNAKAAIYALDRLDCRLPLIISATVSDRSGRLLTGQTVEAFYHSIKHAPNLAAFGVNCALGAKEMEPTVRETARFSEHPLIFYPNAGLPDEMGRYNDTPQDMAAVIGSLASDGLLNIVGGCCGTTPEYISAIASAVAGKEARKVPSRRTSILTVSGLETVMVDRNLNLTLVGERTNVAGSRKFQRLVAEEDYEGAISVAAGQVSDGASIIDVNMDDPMVDSEQRMVSFLRYLSLEPEVARAAVMIDSSHWDTIVSALKNVQGKSIVNSISLKDGEEPFLRKAREIHSLGAAMVVMAFDEAGQAVTFERKIEICSRAYKLLTSQGIPAEDIIFDVNVLSIGTGIADHSRYGIDFIEAVRWIKTNLPGALTSGGISNLSFSFRGNNSVREAMHSAFLYHAVRAGLDMAIVNPGMIHIYDEIDPELLKRVEDVIFDTEPDSTARLVEYASGLTDKQESDSLDSDSPVGTDLEERIVLSVVKGIRTTLAEDVAECSERLGNPVAVIEGPLMRGMEKVGKLFSEGKMFLPQVVKSAAVMKYAVDSLQPYMISSDSSDKRPKALIATVKGDVHDIGKNILGTVLSCSGFDVTDLGVMVPCEEIVSRAMEISADIICLSGLITPSLNRMEEVCERLKDMGLDIPVFVGGAAASQVHTSVKLFPLYENVHYAPDASSTAVLAKRCVTSGESFRKEEAAIREKYISLYRKGLSKRKDVTMTAFPDDSFYRSTFRNMDLELSYEELEKFVDWRMLFGVCGLKSADPEVEREAVEAMGKLTVKVSVRFFDAFRKGDAIITTDGKGFPMLRDGFSLADYFPENGTSPLGLFAATVKGERGTGLVPHAAAVSLADAASSFVASSLRSSLNPEFKVIMPGIGYPCCPDHSLKRDVLAILPSDLGITLTESAAMMPEESVCGFVIAHKCASYRDIRKVDGQALAEYSSRRGFSEEERKLFLGHLSD